MAQGYLISQLYRNRKIYQDSNAYKQTMICYYVAIVCAQSQYPFGFQECYEEIASILLSY